MKLSTFLRTLPLVLLIQSNAHAQNLLKGIEDDNSRQFITNAFKSSRVINAHSMEMIGSGVMDFRILHRFGPISNGASEMFGLDQASMRMGFDFGLSKNFTLGFGRSTFNKELDGFLKWRLIHQSVGAKSSPVSLLLVAGSTAITLKIKTEL